MVYQNLDLNSAPIVSMVILTYNQETMVAQTIESLLSQKTIYSYEIIIIDDCSTDTTLDVCLKYYKEYPDVVRVVENEVNKGFMRNYHESISEYARGKYIAPVAGDDWWQAQDKIQKQVDFLETHIDYDLVCTDSYVYSQEKNAIEKYLPSDVNPTFLQLMYHNCITAATVCYTKVIFDNYLKNVNPIGQNFICEDLPFWLWIAHYSKIYHIREPLVTYRKQKQSLSHFTSFKKRYDFSVGTLRIRLFYYAYFKLNDGKLLHDIYFDFYTTTLLLSSMLHDKKVEEEREQFFLKENHYIYYLLSKLNNRFASDSKSSIWLHYINKIGLKNHAFKVFGKF